MRLTFKKGVHPSWERVGGAKQSVKFLDPKKVIIPLQQHIGAVCDPLVNIGDSVSCYQKIGDSRQSISAAVHSSVSGNVIDICDYFSPSGFLVKSVIIESSMQNGPVLGSDPDVDSYGQKKILDIIRDSGIVGLGGAGFPAHIKLQPSKPVDTLIVNGCECEPYLTCDYSLMLENTQDIIEGIRLELKVLGIRNAFIALEANKPDAIAAFGRLLEADKDISVAVLRTKYPQGAEKLLIYSVLGRVCRHSALPMDAGVIVSNVATAKAIFDAVYYRKPLVERIVTVAGAVKNPQNILVKIGTPVRDIIDFCGGYVGKPKKLVVGGPMMGVANYTDEIPVTKLTGGILVLDNVPDETVVPCINCGRCVDVCPYNLLPTTIAKASQKENWQLAQLYYAAECMECGCCSYVCPSKIPLVQHIRLAKLEMARRKK
jgi:electron transport complex protein RnfC